MLRDEDLPYALAGGAAAYARGAMPPTHDVDFVIREADADAAARAFRARGMRVEIPPEGWLIKAYDDGCISEHHADFAGALSCVRPLREQVASEERRQLVARIAGEQARGLTVRNEVSVTELLPPERPEVLECPGQVVPAQDVPPPHEASS